MNMTHCFFNKFCTLQQTAEYSQELLFFKWTPIIPSLICLNLKKPNCLKTSYLHKYTYTLINLKAVGFFRKNFGSRIQLGSAQVGY